MAYYSSVFNTFHKPKESEKFFNIESEDFYEFLDSLFFVLDIDIKNYDYSLMTPKNILVSFGKEDFRVFLGDDKAIAELNTISYQIYEQEQLPSLDDANNIGIKQLGFKFDCFFDVNIDQFDKSLAFVKENFDKSTVEKFAIFNNLYGKIQAYPSGENIDSSSFSFFTCLVKVRQQLINEFERRNGIMDINPRFKARGIIVKPSQCFYVMQFNDDEIQEAYDAIAKKLDDELGIDVIKSGDIFDPRRGNDMVENIWQDIMQSKFIIADLSKKNSNVFYELGICDTVGKTVIPICSKTSFNNDYHGKFPFDVQQEHIIIYENGFTGISNLQDEVLKRATAITQGEAINTRK